MNAVILAGGFGKRLTPLTDGACKPMLSVANMPIIDYTISHLWSAGIRDFVFTLGYKPQQIIDWTIGYTGAVCRFSIEHKPLGSLGGVKAVEPLLKDHFFVFSGDIIENINLHALVDKHIKTGAAITMAAIEVEDSSQYGVINVDELGYVDSFIEKPASGGSGLVNAGVYVVDKRILSRVPLDTYQDFAKDLLPTLCSSGELAAYIHTGYWKDCGTIDCFARANFDMQRGGFYKFAPNSFRENRMGISTNAPYNNLIAAKATVTGDVKNSIIAPSAHVQANAKLDNCIVIDGAFVKGKHKNKIISPTFEVEFTPATPDSISNQSQYKSIYVGY